MADAATGAPRETSGRTIALSQNAARRIAALTSEDENKGMVLRIAVSGGGCQGFQYGFSFDDTKKPDDHVFERDGAVVLVDDVSLDLLAGSEIDFVEDMMGSYFRVINPNATSSCGCGSSFSVE